MNINIYKTEKNLVNQIHIQERPGSNNNYEQKKRKQI